jgi:ethanolamine ammonia-lyase large subunit
MNEPILNRFFTVEDIHKMREYNYEVTKNFTVEELRNYYKKSADEGERRIKEFRKGIEPTIRKR